jgi:hypothetical protein
VKAAGVARFAGLLVILLSVTEIDRTRQVEAAAPLPLPPRSWDGTFYVLQPGTYTGNVSCPNIAPTQHCVHLWHSSGITLQDFSVISSGGAIQADNNSTIRNGTIIAGGGVTADAKTNVTIDNVTFDTPGNAIGLFDTAVNCESLATKRSRNHVVRNSTFRNREGDETVWIKCGQNILVEGNYFQSGSQWSVSLPDSLDVRIRANTFDLTKEPTNWLAIELPRTLRVEISRNTFFGPAGDWAVWLNSGTNFVTMTNNCVQGVGVMLGVPPIGTVSRNTRC